MPLASTQRSPTLADADSHAPAAGPSRQGRHAALLEPRLVTELCCPHCHRLVRIRLVRHETALAARSRQAGARAIPILSGGQVCVVLDDVRSTWNVGSFFRTCDGLGVRHLFLCGITAIPDQREIRKTALGAEEAVSWSYHPHPFEAMAHVRASGGVVMAVEHVPRAVTLRDFVPSSSRPLALVFGNEPDGVSPETLAVVDGAVWIPMRGVKASLNVAVAAGIVLHHCLATQFGDAIRNSCGVP